VHISDGVLTWPWWTGGFALAIGLAVLGAWRIRDEEIPQVAVLTAAFFVASLIHIPLGPVTSAHLLLNGLMAMVLRTRVALAIPVGLFLQAALIGHGGFYSLGVNSCIMVLPALVAWQIFALLQRIPWLRRPWFRSGLVGLSCLAWILSLIYSAVLLLSQNGTATQQANAFTFNPLTLSAAVGLALLGVWFERGTENAPEFPIGLLLGQFTVLATALLTSLVLAWGAEEPESWEKLAQLLFVAHVPIALVEGIVLGFTVGFLVRVKPEMLRWTLPEETKCSVEPLP
jgi:cobalt/nickel transport system permease protein